MQENQAILSAIPELEGEVPAEQFAESSLWAPVMWSIVVVIALAAGAFIWWLRRSRRREKPQPTALDTALARLQELEDKLPPVRESSLQLSMIIREYLQGQMQDPALYETHEEFSQRIDSLASVPEECQYDTRYLLEKLADLKYAGNREQDPVRVRTLIEQTRTLLIRIRESQQPAAGEPPTVQTSSPTA